MFAKLYGKDDNQVLVKLDGDEEGNPEVRFYFKPEGLGVCSVASTFKDTDKGWEAAEATFAAITEEKARSIVNQVNAEIDKLTQGE